MSYFGNPPRGDAFLPALAGLALQRGPAILRAGKRILGVGGTAAAAAGLITATTNPFAPPGMLPTPGIQGQIQRFLPGGATGYKKRRRTNFGNPKALNRAIRRVDGFGRLVSRSKKAVARANSTLNPKRGGVAARKRSR